MKNFSRKKISAFVLTTALASQLVMISSCGTPKDRPLKVAPDIAAETFETNELHDISENSTSDKELNMKFLSKAIEKIKDEKLKSKLKELNENFKLAYLIVEGKLLLLEILSTAVDVENSLTQEHDNTFESEPTLLTIEAIRDYKKLRSTQNPDIQLRLRTRITEEDLSASDSQTRFKLLAEIKIECGVLVQKKTDYDEKTGLLELSSTSLEQATHITLKEQIEKTEEKTIIDASGVVQ